MAIHGKIDLVKGYRSELGSVIHPGREPESGSHGSNTDYFMDYGST